MKEQLMNFLKSCDNRGSAESLISFEEHIKSCVSRFNEENNSKFNEFESFCDYLEFAGYE